MTQPKEYSDAECFADIDIIIEKFEGVISNIVEHDKELHMQPRISLTLDTPGLINSLRYKNQIDVTDYTKDISAEAIETFLLTNELASGFEISVYDDADEPELIAYDVIFSYNPYGDSVVVMHSDELFDRYEDEEDE